MDSRIRPFHKNQALCRELQRGKIISEEVLHHLNWNKSCSKPSDPEKVLLLHTPNIIICSDTISAKRNPKQIDFDHKNRN